MPCPGLLILLSFFSSGEMVMPKWCKWSFLLELLYLEQPSAAVAYSHFSPRWWHFHNGFFRWISSSSWTFWQKKAPIFEASIGGPDCFFLGVPSTNRYQPQSERWQRQAKDKEGTPLKKSLTLTRLVETTLPRQFPRKSTSRAEDCFQTVQNWPDVFVGLQIES